MPFELEARRCQLRDTLGTPVDVEGFVALATEKMVMVTPVGRLVAHIIDAQIHGPHFTGVLQAPELPIDRCNAQRRHYGGR